MKQGFDTRAVHAGLDPEEPSGAVSPPVHLSSTYRMAEVDHPQSGFAYGRVGNPTRDALEDTLADLDGGAQAMAFASGVAATDAVFRSLCRPGDRVVVPRTMYGGTVSLNEHVHGSWGVTVQHAAADDLDAVAAAVDSNTRLIWLETPNNPLLGISDIAAVASLAHEHGVLLAVDSTFATPYLQRPIELGADIVVHSTTKYLGGHSDVVGGAVVVASDEIGEPIRNLQVRAGAVASPFDSWLVLRGLRTLPLRMRRHCDSASEIARWLGTQGAVSEVLYPGLPDHPGHDIATRQMSQGGTSPGAALFGGVVSFRMKRGEEAARTVCASTRLITLGGSLGGVESLIGYPALMSHSELEGTDRAVGDDLVRLSVGLEDVEDLKADLSDALAPWA